MQASVGSGRRRMALSYSRIAALACLHRFLELYVLKSVQESRAVPLLIGGFAHEVLDRWTRGGDFSEAALRTVFEQLWAERPSQLVEDERDELERMVLRFGRQHADGFPALVEGEHEIALTWDGKVVASDDWDRVFFRVKIDRLDCPEPTRVRIVDYKTNWSGRSDPFQLEVYAAVVALAHPAVTTIEVEIDYIRQGTGEVKTFDRETALKTWDRIHAISDELEARLDKASTAKRARPGKDWPASPNPACAYCECECPLVPGLLAVAGDAAELGPLRDGAHASEVFGTIVLLGRELGRRRKRLKEFVDTEGPVRAAGHVAEYVKREGWDVEARQILELADEVGLEVLDVLPLLNGPGKRDMLRAIKRPGKLGQVVELIKVRHATEDVEWSEHVEKGDE